jgi:hypothetical protein
MLYNIKINAGQYTEEAKQGKFINLIFADGEITARIRMMDGQVFQTPIVSGMSFPVPVGFVSVSFSGSETQQIRVWLSNLPLDYVSNETKAVGSSVLRSSVGAVGFGSPVQLMPVSIGRKKITLNPEKAIFIGALNTTASSAIPLKANENFTIETQGAVYGFSDNKADKVKEIADLSQGVLEPDSEVFWADTNINKGSLTYLSGADRYISFVGNQLYVRDVNSNTYISPITDISGDGDFGRMMNDDVVYFQVTHLRIINNNDATLRSVMSFFAAAPSHITVNPTNDFIFSSRGNFTDGGFESDGAAVIDNPIANSSDNTIQGCRYSPSGLLIIISDNYFCTSADDGVTWSALRNLPVMYKVVGGQTTLTANELNGYFYYAATDDNVYFSADGGVSFSLFKENPFVNNALITGIHAIGNSVALIAYNGLSYTDDGVNWSETESGNRGSSSFGVCISPDGIVGSFKSDSFLFKGISTAVVGGVNVRILEEAN